MRKRTSLIWKMPRDEFEALVKRSKTITDILRSFNFVFSHGNYKTVHARLKEEAIDYSHIPLGKGCNKGRKFPDKAVPLEEVMIENSSYARGALKKRLLKKGILKNQCVMCGQEPEHCGQPLVMILDHINGINNDHRKENLRLLCPNCNSQTSTFSGRQRKKHYSCKICGKKIVKGSVNCHKCAAKQQLRKIVDRPSKGVIMQQIKDLGYCGTARVYKVSDNTIRKWLK